MNITLYSNMHIKIYCIYSNEYLIHLKYKFTIFNFFGLTRHWLNALESLLHLIFMKKENNKKSLSVFLQRHREVKSLLLGHTDHK